MVRSRVQVIPGFPEPASIRRLWGLPPLRVRALRAGHGAQIIVECDDGGRWILKRSRLEGAAPDRCASLGQILSAIRVVQQRAPDRFIPEIRPLAVAPQANGEDLVHRDGNALFYLMQLVHGRRPSYRRFDHARQVLRALGVLHRLTRQLPTAPANSPAQAIDPSTVLDELAVREGRLGERLMLPREAPERWIIHAYSPKHRKMMRLAREAREYLAQRLAQLPAEQRLCTAILTHGDSHENNYLLDPEGEHLPWLLDLETFSYRPAIMDLVVPLHYSCFYSGWDFDMFDRLVQEYASQTILPPAERALLGALLIYPRHWMRALWSLMRHNNHWDLATHRYLIACLAAHQKKRRFVAALRERWEPV